MIKSQDLNARMWYHASQHMIRDFENGAPGEGIHFGDIDQAKMRSSGYLHEVALRSQNPKRVKDQQSWKKTAQRARSAGADVLVYLNRYEGLSVDRVMDLIKDGTLDRLDDMSDAAVRKRIPEAQDSLLVLYPDIILPRRICVTSGTLILEHEPI